MPSFVCHYHIVWATKHRQPLITGAMESFLFEKIRSRSENLKSTVHATNGTMDHLHVALSIPPSISVASWVKDVKGATTADIRKSLSLPDFQWQIGYGVLTFGAKNLAFILDYIDNQKTHHAQNSFKSYLERTEDL